MKKLSVVVSAYNEELSIAKMHEELVKVLGAIPGYDWEIIIVDDGSADKTYQNSLLLCNENPNTKLVSFTTNFGHESAMIAGIDHAKGDAIICMDADLQHPPL